MIEHRIYFNTGAAGYLVFKTKEEADEAYERLQTEFILPEELNVEVQYIEEGYACSYNKPIAVSNHSIFYK